MVFDQNTRPSFCFKIRGQVFETPYRTFQAPGRVSKTLIDNLKLGGEFGKIGQVFKKLDRVFICNTVYADPISQVTS